MSIIATCGHAVSNVDELFDLQLQDINDVGRHCVSYGVYCKECSDKYEEAGSIIRTKEDEYRWMNTQQPPHSLYDAAVSLKKHSDVNVSKFASDVCDFITSQNKLKSVVVRVNTDNAFTLFIDDNNITGTGKIQFNNVDDAVIALMSAKISWVRPIKAHTPDGLYLVNSDDTDHCSFYVKMCHSAAIAMNDGEMKYHKKDGPYLLTVEVI